MTNLNTIQKDTAELLPDEQQIVFDLINLLRKRSRQNQSTNSVNPNQDISSIITNNTQVSPTAVHQAKSTYQKFVESGLIGCVEVDEDLSTTYKQVLAQELAKKYDHR
jgi:protein-arginine kinase activator protein McsA